MTFIPMDMTEEELPLEEPAAIPAPTPPMGGVSDALSAASEVALGAGGQESLGAEEEAGTIVTKPFQGANYVQQDIPPWDTRMGNASTRTLMAMRGLDPEEGVTYLKQRFAKAGHPELTAGVENGEIWYGTPTERYALDPNTWSDLLVGDVAELAPEGARLALQTAGSLASKAGMVAKANVGGYLGGATELVMQMGAGIADDQDIDWSEVAEEAARWGAFGAGGEAVVSGLKGATQLAKEAGPYLAKIGGGVASGIANIGQATLKLTKIKAEELYKVLKPSAKDLEGPRFGPSLDFIYKYFPEGLDGLGIEQIKETAKAIGQTFKNGIPQIYNEIVRQKLSPKISWDEAKGAFQPIIDYAKGVLPQTTPDEKVLATNVLNKLKISFTGASIPKGKKAFNEAVTMATDFPLAGMSIAQMWNISRQMNTALFGRDGALRAGTFGRQLSSLASQGYRQLISKSINDDVFRAAVKGSGSPELSKILHYAEKVRERLPAGEAGTSKNLLGLVNDISSAMQNITPVIKRQAGRVAKDAYDSPGFFSTMGSVAKQAIGPGSVYALAKFGGPLAGIAAGGVGAAIGANAIRNSGSYILASRAAARGLAAPMIREKLTNNLATRATKVVAEDLADAILTNPLAQEWVSKLGMMGAQQQAASMLSPEEAQAEGFQRFLDAPEAMKQTWLDELKMRDPSLFEPEPNKIKPEEKGAYDTRLMESVLNRKVGAVEGYKAHQKIIKDGTVANGNW